MKKRKSERYRNLLFKLWYEKPKYNTQEDENKAVDKEKKEFYNGLKEIENAKKYFSEKTYDKIIKAWNAWEKNEMENRIGCIKAYIISNHQKLKEDILNDYKVTEEYINKLLAINDEQEAVDYIYENKKNILYL